MPEILTIDKNNTLPKAQNFNFLKKEGISYIEDLAGKVWTDYNTHDPGITLLEAMCYALTDLGYRTSFDIKDIIAPANKPVGGKWNKLLYTAREILPCNPLTLIDYRKLIIDTEGVKNAWIEISDDYEILIYLQAAQDNPPGELPYNLTYDFKKGDDVLRLRGLYKVFVEYEDDILEEKKEDDVAKIIWQKLQFHRNLTEDFVSVSSVEYEDFPVQATIQVSEGTDIEMATARIFKVIYDFFSPSVNFYSLEQMLEKNLSAEDIFEGPILNYGFIDTEELEKSERSKNIHLSDIINIISSIEGVIAVKKIAFTTGSESPFSNFTEWINNVKDKQKTPRLDIKNSNISFERSGDRHRTDSKKQVNMERVSALFSFLKSDNFKTRLRGSGKDLQVPEGEFMDIADYYPFQKELPAMYGMEETFINEKDIVDKISIATAVNELLAEKTGINGASLIAQLRNEPRHAEYVENMIDEIIVGFASNIDVVKTIIDKVWDDEKSDKSFKASIGTLLGHDKDYITNKNHLYNYVEHQPEYIVPSDKSRALYWLASKELKKSLTSIKSTGDIAKLGSAYKKYLVSKLGKTKKLVLQLRGFLMAFEQILADYLSQLSRIREIFSFSENVTQTFYPQLINGINDMETLFIDFKRYEAHQLDMIETPEKFSDKRNDILDHLLARFGESVEKYDFFVKEFSGKDAQGILIKDKINFLSDYVQVSSYRGKGYNYADQNENWNSNNVEGLKKRISRLLGIKNYTRKRIATNALVVEKIKIEKDVDRYIVKLVDPENHELVLLRSKEFEFENEAITILNYILEQGYNRSLYKEEGRGDKWHFVLNRLTPENVPEPVAESMHYKNSNERNDTLEKVINTLNTFSGDENFHIVEHILLRPKVGARQKGGSLEEVSLLPVEYVPDKISLTDNQGKATPYKFKIVQVKDQSQKGRNTWKLSLMKNDAEFLKVSEDFIFYKHLLKRIERIREFASDGVNYTREQTVDGYFTFKIMAKKTVLAESKKNFKKAEDIDEEIKNLVNFFSYEFGLTGNNTDENNSSLYADPYSFQISVIFPSWQRRFRSNTFKHLLEKTIYLETPSHIYPHMYWADHDQMRQFEDAYKVWIKEMAFNEIPATDVVNKMIEALNNLKS